MKVKADLSKTDKMAPSNRKMIVLHGIAIIGSEQKPISIMVDTGCTTSCMPESTARKIGLPFRRTRRRKVAVLADGSERPMNYEAMLTFRLGPSYTCTLRIDLSSGTLAPKDMLLGMDWLRIVNPKINFNPLSLKITDRNGRVWEVVGMRPPGQPYYCLNHGYRCGRDKDDGVRYSIPVDMATGGGDLGHSLPFDSFIQRLPIYRQEMRSTKQLPCACKRGP